MAEFTRITPAEKRLFKRAQVLRRARTRLILSRVAAQATLSLTAAVREPLDPAKAEHKKALKLLKQRAAAARRVLKNVDGARRWTTLVYAKTLDDLGFGRSE